jgi:hypothetical protein
VLALKALRGGMVLAIMAGAAHGPVAAEMYRYRDADGRVVFSDTAPPPGASAESTLMVPATSATPVAPPSPMAPPAPEPSAAAPDPDAVTAERAKNCEKARDALARLEKSPRLRVKNAEGYYYYMDEDERARRIRAAESSEAAWCSPASGSP